MRKKILVLFAAMVFGLGFTAKAQQKSPTASFATTTHDFGQIKETDGLATYKFEFTNTGATPLILKNVQASCGCTTPNWPKEPILPGTKNSIIVSYNPQNRPGHFEKQITVTSNGDPETIVLKILGEVVPKPPQVEDLFPTVINGLRLKSTQISINNVEPEKKTTQSTEVYNSTDKPLNIKFVNLPNYIAIKVVPEAIPAKSKASLEVTYDAAIKNDWGLVWDNIRFQLNGKDSSAYTLAVSANIQEDFGKLTQEQKQNAPNIDVPNSIFEFGTIKQGEKVQHEFAFKNIGKSNLIIHKVQTTCGCTVANMQSQVIKPGESSVISVSFDSHGKSGVQDKGITVLSNDPSNSRIMLHIKGTIE
jgi:hypothetical protein